VFDGGERERDELRKDRHRERERQRNLERAAPGTRSKLERNRERDVSEQIALGLPAKTAAAQGADGLFDSRLFNQSRGLNSGYDDDEGYNVYSEPWRNNSSISQSIYRPGKNVDKEAYGGAEDLDNLKKTSRFVADKGFEGTERGAGSSSRSGPVQFERNEEEDPFGLDQFLATAKNASNTNGSSSSFLSNWTGPDRLELPAPRSVPSNPLSATNREVFLRLSKSSAPPYASLSTFFPGLYILCDIDELFLHGSEYTLYPSSSS
jgi:hypothetical protein